MSSQVFWFCRLCVFVEFPFGITFLENKNGRAIRRWKHDEKIYDMFSRFVTRLNHEDEHCDNIKLN